MISLTLQYLGIAFVSSAVFILLSNILQAVIRRPADYYSAEETMFGGAEYVRSGIDKQSPEEIDAIRKMLEQAYAEQQASDQEPEPTAETGPVVKPDEEQIPSAEQEIITDFDLEAGASAEPVVAAEDENEPEHPAEPELVVETEEETVPSAKPDTTPEMQKAAFTWSESEITADDEQETKASAEPAKTPDTKKRGRGRKPSMKMKKAELIEIAEGMGIEIPEKATKQIILDLIRENSNSTE